MPQAHPDGAYVRSDDDLVLILDYNDKLEEYRVEDAVTGTVRFMGAKTMGTYSFVAMRKDLRVEEAASG